MKIKRTIAALLLAVMCFCTANPLAVFAANEEKTTPSGIAYGDIGSSIDSFIKEREAGLAGCSVSVFDSNGVIFTGYYGHADIENDIAVDENTVYEWASASKIIVWTCVMQQWERGNIDLEADIREYLPEGFLTKLQYPEEKITMIDLMNHKAGFQESFYENQQCGEDGLFDSLEEAVRYCECYQSYHVGEYTAYSNWSTALAAYIVERVSGVDYVTYVHENIFEPLGMEHTSIDPKRVDNEWVGQQRNILKCYERYGEEKYNQDYGIGKAHVQLFPAGAAISTLEDFSTFGQAFVAQDCPLFENNSTRDEMFKASSYYGDTDVAKNCHGLWTQHYLVQTIGHGGNTFCTSNLEFDPVSGLGIAVFTNEAGETAFCNGIPVLLYGHMYDRPECAQYADAGTDLSGVYYGKRAIVEGAGMATQYMGGFLPIKKTNDGTYEISLFGRKMANDQEYVPVGQNLYILKDNGREMLIYAKDGVYEMEVMDSVLSKSGLLPTVISYGFIIFGILCLAALLIKLIVFIVRKLRKKERVYTVADKQILAQQLIYGISGIVFACFTLIIGVNNPTFVVVSGILAALLGLCSIANGVALCYNTVRSDSKALIKIKQFVWAALCVAYGVFIAAMQLYCFWKL